MPTLSLKFCRRRESTRQPRGLAPASTTHPSDRRCVPAVSYRVINDRRFLHSLSAHVASAAARTSSTLAERVYRLLKYGQYVRQSAALYEAAYQERLAKALAQKAARLGYRLVPETATP